MRAGVVELRELLRFSSLPDHLSSLPPAPPLPQLTLITAESIIDKAIAVHAIGGVYERQTPTPFMCLLLRLLQLQPEKEILFEYLLAEEFK